MMLTRILIRPLTCPDFAVEKPDPDPTFDKPGFGSQEKPDPDPTFNKPGFGSKEKPDPDSTLTSPDLAVNKNRIRIRPNIIRP